jgi:hypothetical protein
MRSIAALLLLLLVLPGCSKEADNSVSPPPTDARGTAVGANHVFAANGGLEWSGVTNETVGASSATPAAGTGLLAMHIPDGAIRVIDPVPPKLITLAQDGSRAYYMADLPPADGDSVVLRRVALSGGGAPQRLAAEPEGSFISYAVSADQNWVAWAGAGDDPFAADTLWLLEVATGARTKVGLGVPVVLSPGGEYLLYHPDPGSQALKLWVRASGISSDYGPVIPIGAGPPAWRWDAGALKVAYIVPPRDLFLARPELGGIPVLVYRAPDSLNVIPPVWSPDGQRLAVWGSRPAANGNYVNHLLYVADITALTGVQVATGTEPPGGVAISANGLQVVELYGENLYVADVHGLASLSATARARGPARAVRR